MIKYSKAELIEMIDNYADTEVIVCRLQNISQCYRESGHEVSVSASISEAAVRLESIFCHLSNIKELYCEKNTGLESIKDHFENSVLDNSGTSEVVKGVKGACEVIKTMALSCDELWFADQAIQNLEGMFDLLMEFYKLYLMSEQDNGK